MTTVALATCTELPGLDEDEGLLLEALRGKGIRPVPAVWDDPSVDWGQFDSTVVRNTWDYPERRAIFLDWAKTVPRLYNPAPILAWNTDKRYLADLAAAGIAVVPTDWLTPDAPATLPDHGEWVLKPTVGAGSRNAGRYDLSSPEHRELARAHVARLHAAGATVMAQPYLDDVDVNGETALIHFDGRYSHAIRKSAMLDGPYSGDVGLYKAERITRTTGTDGARALAQRVLAAIPGLDTAPLYARVDVVDRDGTPTQHEVELCEPSLFFGHTETGAEAFADAITARL